jgi:hypothetical protein
MPAETHRTAERLSRPAGRASERGAAADCARAARPTAEHISKHRALCFYCLLGSATTWAALAQALREAGGRGASPGAKVTCLETVSNRVGTLKHPLTRHRHG